MPQKNEPETLPEAIAKYPSYNLRCYVGGIFFSVPQSHFEQRDFDRFHGDFHIDHGCNEIDLRNVTEFTSNRF